MENKKKLSTFKKIMVTVGLAVIAIFIALQDVHGYDSSNQGANVVDKWGYFHFKINGDKTTNLQIRISRSSSPGWNTFRDNATTWTASIYSGTNNHNVRFSNGSKSMSVTTKLDQDGHYYIFNLPIVYDMPAHYQYTGWGSDRPDIVARFNLDSYSQYNNTNYNTASASGNHSASKSSRSINLQINAAQCGIKTYNKYFYNSILWFNLGKPTRKVTQNHYYWNAANSTWNQFNTTSTNVTDGGWFAPYNVSAPSGYSPGNNYGYYASNGNSLGGGTVGSNGFTVCDNNVVHVHYYPNTYYVYYNANGGTGAPPTQAFTYNSGASISRTVPSRVGYTFTGWNYSGNLFQPGQAIPSGWWSFTLTAQWKINSYTLTYNANGGTVSPSSKTLNYGAAYGTLPIPSKKGYTFLGWFTSPSGGTQVSSSTVMQNSNVTIYAHWKNNVPTFTGPSLENADNNPIKPFVDDGYLIIQKGDTFTPHLYMFVSDTEDGNLTGKMEISCEVPLLEGKATQSGIYNVLYSIRDSGGASATYTLKVLVNEAPEIKAGERTFFLNQYQVGISDLLKKVTSKDLEDGNITSKVKLLSIEYPDRVDTQVQYLDTSKLGDFKVTYEVTDKYKKTVTKQTTIHVNENDSVISSMIKTSFRFISKDFLSTLDNTSKWVINPSLNQKLKHSLNSETPSKTYTFSSQKVKQMKQYIDSDSYTKDSQTNEDFRNTFLR